MCPDATYLVWCDFREFGDWRTVSERLINEARVALSGGTFFGPAGEGWFPVSTAAIRENNYVPQSIGSALCLINGIGYSVFQASLHQGRVLFPVRLRSGVFSRIHNFVKLLRIFIDKEHAG